MKNISFSFLIILLIFGCKNEPEKISLYSSDPYFKGCDSLTKKAELDYKNGTRDYTIMGTVYLTEFERYYSEFMKTNHNITMKANCTPEFPQECYETSLNSMLEKEYGENFIELTRKKAKSEFQQQ
tara:strand:+ start:1406 stop:1783 length:378 start_codon:yes stop_codon:yes gene_type:complete